MGVLTGTGGGMEAMSLYEASDSARIAAHNAEEARRAEQEKNEKEAESLFEKSYSCPVCGESFKALNVRAGKGRLIGTEQDLRPRYENIEPLKYDVVMCPHCGCASIARYWGNMTQSQIRDVKDNIASAFKPRSYSKGYYTYEEALERYQIALANAIIKQLKNSESAYICLKAGWLVSARYEELKERGTAGREELDRLKTKADEYLSNALEGLINARQTENFPICGMDESTLDYLIAALSVRFDKLEQAAKLIGPILSSRTAGVRVKDKARDLKEEIMRKH